MSYLRCERTPYAAVGTRPVAVTAVPEPITALLAALAFIGLLPLAISSTKIGGDDIGSPPYFPMARAIIGGLEMEESKRLDYVHHTGTTKILTRTTSMPPKEGMAMGTMISAPLPVDDNTGSKARIVVAEVIMAGRTDQALELGQWHGCSHGSAASR